MGYLDPPTISLALASNVGGFCLPLLLEVICLCFPFLHQIHRISFLCARQEQCFSVLRTLVVGCVGILLRAIVCGLRLGFLVVLLRVGFLRLGVEVCIGLRGERCQL